MAFAEPPAQVAVSPPRIEIALDGTNRTDALHVVNLSDRAVRVKLSTAHWDLDERNQVRVIAPTEQSLDQWLIVNPLEATIPPKEQQTIRLAVRPRVSPEPGEHRAMIYIEQQPDERAGTLDKTGLNLRYRVGVAVYATAGEVRRAGRVHGVVHRLEGKDLLVGLDIESTGNAYARPSARFGIWRFDTYPGDQRASEALLAGEDALGRPLSGGPVPELPVLAGTRRTLEARTERPEEPGRYVIAVAGMLANVPFTRSVDLRIE